MNLEDAFEVRTIVSKRQSLALSTTNGINDDAQKPQQPSEFTEGGAFNKSNNISQLSTPPEGIAVSHFDFENDLGASRVYRRAQRDTMDFSFRSSIAHTNAWSVFSGLSLSDVSIISAIALPLYPEEIANAQHYGFGELQAMISTAQASYAPRARSLYQECLDVELRLSQIDGFPEIFATLRDGSEEEDPLTFLIQVFRTGAPLLVLLERVLELGNLTHSTQLGDHINSQEMPNAFIKACIDDLGFQPDECFSVGDLMGSDTTGFIKVRAVIALCIGWHSSDPIMQVVRVVTQLLDILTSNGVIEPIDLATLVPEGEQRLTNPSPKDIIVEGFLVDERSYVDNLERLLELKRKIETDSRLSKDVLNGIVLNNILSLLDSIVDRQRQFLLKMEMTARKPSEKQSWAVHFEDWSLISSIYAYFIISEKGAKEYIRTILAKRRRFKDDDLNSILRDCLRLLYLPSQRLPKYSGFLQVRPLLLCLFLSDNYSCSSL
jgi:cell division control protein 24